MYDSSSTKMEKAQWYASKLGWAVFPCHTSEQGGSCSCGEATCKSVGKHPITSTGVKGATTDTEILRRYFGGDYEAANIALATGEVSGVWVIDVDDMASLHVLERDNAPLPRTVTARTGNGGRHFLFRLPSNVAIRNSTSKVAPKIDVRGEGGYIILPPSVHRSGKPYEWLVSPDESPIADAPEWLLELATKTTTEAPPLTIHRAKNLDERLLAYLDHTPPAVSGEGGHNRTYGLICRVFEIFPELRHRDDGEMLILLQEWNGRCQPPWTERELLHKIRDARLRSDAHREGEIHPCSEESGTDGDDAGLDVEWPLLHSDALHGLAGAFVRRIEPHSEADSVAMLVTFLTAFGSCVGRNAHYRVGGDRHHPNLFSCLVGSSSRARKGMSLGYVLDVFAGVDPSWSERRMSGLSSGEGLVHALRDDDVKGDSGTFTVNGGIADKRIWVVESEFGQVLQTMKRDGNTLSATLRNAWDRGELNVMTRREPLRATECPRQHSWSHYLTRVGAVSLANRIVQRVLQ